MDESESPRAACRLRPAFERYRYQLALRLAGLALSRLVSSRNRTGSRNSGNGMGMWSRIRGAAMQSTGNKRCQLWENNGRKIQTYCCIIITLFYYYNIMIIICIVQLHPKRGVTRRSRTATKRCQSVRLYPPDDRKLQSRKSTVLT